mmetsp:Transcript_95413/g.172157  ORF Transcript_95413/g.172157 Transcript_95413/m.172157 type:complete len:230 (+) Transcript_95413:274-963(+)
MGQVFGAENTQVSQIFLDEDVVRKRCHAVFRVRVSEDCLLVHDVEDPLETGHAPEHERLGNLQLLERILGVRMESHGMPLRKAKLSQGCLHFPCSAQATVPGRAHHHSLRNLWLLLLRLSLQPVRIHDPGPGILQELLCTDDAQLAFLVVLLAFSSPGNLRLAISGGFQISIPALQDSLGNLDVLTRPPWLQGHLSEVATDIILVHGDTGKTGSEPDGGGGGAKWRERT